MQTLRTSGRQAAWFIAIPLLLLSGCVYPYDSPYGYQAYRSYRPNPDNCGTPTEPRSCAEYDAPSTGYQYTQPGQQYAPPQYAPPQYAPPQYPPQQYPPQQYPPQQYPPQQYGSPTPLAPGDPYGRGTYAPPPTQRPDYTPTYPPPPGSNDRDDDGPNNGR